MFIHFLRITFMRSLESKSASASPPVRRRRRDGDGDEVVKPRAKDPAPDDDTAGNNDAAPPADEAALPEAPSLSAAGVGLGIVGLIGTVAVGAGTKAQTMPSPKPLSPAKPVEPITPIAPGKPVDPVTPVTPVKPAEPTTPVTPVKPVEPVAPVTPVKPVDPIAPVTPVKPTEPLTPETPVRPEPARFSLSNAHVIEDTTGARELVFLVQRSGDLNQTGSVRFSVQADKSTVAADDLIGVQTGTVSFKAGEAQQLVRLLVNGDYLRETDEQVLVKLSDPIGGKLDRAEGIGTIHEVDVTRLQAAYGMRDLNAELGGSAIRVRRSSDDTEMDIGFDANDQLDREALLNFVGRGASDKGYVTHWYNQSGHSRHMEAVDPLRQGVIVHGGKIVTRSDGSPAISFNAGRNGTADDSMASVGVSSDSWKSAVIYANVQSEGWKRGSLFNLGNSGNGRLSSHYPNEDGSVIFDVYGASGDARLVTRPDRDKPLVGVADNVVFEAHSDNSDEGTETLNRTDAMQVVFRNGIAFAFDGTLPKQFLTTTPWTLASHRGDSQDDGDFQQAMVNEFLVYLAKDNSTPTVQNLIGTAKDDVLTYSGEKDLKRIDGLAGEDTLYVSGDTGLDLKQFSGGIKGIEQFWLDNGNKNLVVLSRETVAALDAKTLTIRLDDEDVVFIGDDEIRREEGLRARLQEINPAVQFTVVIDGQVVL
ncbi:Calx-beta domain-containing protein [Roseateles sp. L2-2]|uniref:Calx-beta domain-containing protein n=1 Tax=Roseateles TaxID=93681 RepID=UPI003D36638A